MAKYSKGVLTFAARDFEVAAVFPSLYETGWGDVSQTLAPFTRIVTLTLAGISGL